MKRVAAVRMPRRHPVAKRDLSSSRMRSVPIFVLSVTGLDQDFPPIGGIQFDHLRTISRPRRSAGGIFCIEEMRILGVFIFFTDSIRLERPSHSNEIAYSV